MRVLVTGASGFLGSHVAEQLVAAGHDVRALVRKSSNRKFLVSLGRVEFAEGSVEDAARVADAVKGVDAIVHSAGLVKARNEAEFFETNVVGTRNILEAARQHVPNLRRLVLVSSLAGVGPSPDGSPILSDQVPSPVTRYGRSKLAAEKAALNFAGELPITILRPAAIYGPRDVEIFAMFQAVSRGVLPTVGLRESTISIVFGADAAAACLRAIDAEVPSGSTYFVDDGEPMKLTSMLEEIERALGRKAILRVHLPTPIVYAAAVATEIYGRAANKAVMLTRDKVNEIRQPHWVCSSVSTRRDLGWSPKTRLPEGAAITAKWYRDNGWL